MAVAANVRPNDGQERNANAEAAFGRLAVSTVNEREPIRKADGGSPDFDASEGRNNEGEKVREGFVLLEGEDDSSFSRGREKEKCVLEGEGEESSVFWRESNEHKALLVPLGPHAPAGFAL